ncbi:class I SAM-dependent DNA methyltransferase [Thalassotalea sp. SU-HH00458]|uniref:type I restriction-modification system subunit M n=1 Tax=Thalassotalea sp. SU-HH00458 TaxID=3127657 RepID=UPI00310A93C7
MSEELKTNEVSNLSSFIWKIADSLWGDFTHSDFDRIIMPLLLLRRLECVLEKTKDDVVEEYEAEKDSGMDLDRTLRYVSGFPFYNTSQYTLDSLGSTSTKDNLENYISQFSANVRKIFEEFGFYNTISELENAKLLYFIVSKFSNIDLHPDVVSDRVMSNTYEQLVRDFAASVNQKAGEFMSPRDAVHLATSLVIAPDEGLFNETGVIRTLYDPTMGTGGFLFDAISEIKGFSNTVKVVPYGQELNPKTHAMALTSMMFQGFETENLKQGNTLSDDKLSTKKFHYCLSNPPFGIKWEKDKKLVLDEHKTLGYAGRFGPGLPRVSDGSMLFLMHLVDKMESPKNGGGRVGIILSGSPLFTGDAGSGESEIRRWLLENDYVEGILALPNDMFFNTGIGTYIWILTNKKSAERKGTVQLVNLADEWTQMRKSEGSKRKFISQGQITQIVNEYDEYVDSKRTKIFKNTDFAYRKVAIKRPLRAIIEINDEKITTLSDVKVFTKLTNVQQSAWVSFIKDNVGQHEYEFFINAAKAHNNQGDFGKVGAPLGKTLTAHFMERNEDAPIVTDAKGNDIADTTLNDNETVPYGDNVEDYLAREVTPHVPDAFIDYSVRDEKDGEVGIVGYEINFNRYFYKYVPPRSLTDIDTDLKASESRIQALLQEVAE